ncbi:hypothetical protein [Sandaracinus amylolyticus]|uniref:Lipoprotein n=1 Tax=Sandaracinus amylolyticus TaxID=927083 RepID=A0A0F6WAM1_9BACT|nr:hypothetical protein [Sandaracinus amylolyticus]AKF11621.1 hypothetical protein DB32_008770 [Sandaracinus amylolyticus]
MSRALGLVFLGLAGCARSHVRGPGDGPADAAVIPDAVVIPDAAAPPALELPAGYSVWDAVATVDDEVCIAGVRDSPEPSPLLPDVRDDDAFIACFTPAGPTRSRAVVCPGGRFGVHRLATHAAGDLFALVQDECTPEEGMGVLRLDRALEVRAQLDIAAAEEGPFARALSAAGDVVVVGGALRTAGRIGDVRDRQGPFVAVLAADDLRVLRVEAGPPLERPTPIERVYHVVAGDRGVLVVGYDLEGGAFEPAGGPFVITTTLPDGPLVSIPAPPFEPLEEAFWHPDGRPVVIGPAGLGLGVQLGGEDHVLDLRLFAPTAAFHGDRLLIAGDLIDGAPMTIAGRTFTRERDGWLLVELDASTLEPLAARALGPDHAAYELVSLPGGALAIVATIRGPTPARRARASRSFGDHERGGSELKKRAGPGDGVRLKSYAAAIEECSAIPDALAVLERLLTALRAEPQPRDLSGNIGHFSDWLYEARQKGSTFSEPSLERALAMIDALSEASSAPPASSDLARIRDDLTDAFTAG